MYSYSLLLRGFPVTDTVLVFYKEEVQSQLRLWSLNRLVTSQATEIPGRRETSSLFNSVPSPATGTLLVFLIGESSYRYKSFKKGSPGYRYKS